MVSAGVVKPFIYSYNNGVSFYYDQSSAFVWSPGAICETCWLTKIGPGNYIAVFISHHGVCPYGHKLSSQSSHEYL